MLDKVKVGGITYDVEYKELEVDDEGVQLGWCKKTETLIEINNHNISEQLQEQTLIHEIMHAVFVGAGLEDEEDTVNRVSLVLHQVLKDNDFSWLRDKEVETEVFASYSDEETIKVHKS